MNPANPRPAFGAPGIEPRWTARTKEGIGTAYHTSSRVWFTISHGIIDEIYRSCCFAFTGGASNSLLLESFGIDSVVELFSASVLLWRLQVEARGRATAGRVEAVERRAARWVGYSL